MKTKWINTHQGVISVGCNVGWLDTEILESLCVGVDDLIHELADGLVSATDVPPEKLVQDGCERGHDLEGQVDVLPGLEDFPVDQVLDLGHLVLLWSVEFVGLSSGAVVVEHLLEGGSYIDGVNGPQLLLQVVCGDDVSDAGKTVEKTILGTEHGSGSHNSRLGEDVTDNLLTASLGAVKLRGRVQLCRVGRDVNETVDIILGDGRSNAVGALDVDILEVKVLGRIIPTNQVVDNVRMAHGLLDGLGVPEIVFLEGEIM